MNISTKKSKRSSVALLIRAAACAAAGLAMLGGSSVQAQYITQTAADGFGASSITDAARWSDGLAPHSGGAYIDNVAGLVGNTGLVIRTPATGLAYTFGGDSLTLSLSGTLSFKGPNGQAITVNNLNVYNNATIFAVATANAGFTINGSIQSFASSAAPAQIVGTQTAGYVNTVNSSLTGTGVLAFHGGSATWGLGNFVLNSANNTISGGIQLIGAGSAFGLTVNNDGGLGLGNVTLIGTGETLTLQGGTLNNYIASTADLILPSTLGAGTVNLNYSGADTIAGISLDGGATFLTSPGTYGGTGSGATYIETDLSGTGVFQIVAAPEPSTWAMFGIGLVFFAGIQREKCRFGRKVSQENIVVRNLRSSKA